MFQRCVDAIVGYSWMPWHEQMFLARRGCLTEYVGERWKREMGKIFEWVHCLWTNNYILVRFRPTHTATDRTNHHNNKHKIGSMYLTEANNVHRHRSLHPSWPIPHISSAIFPPEIHALKSIVQSRWGWWGWWPCIVHGRDCYWYYHHRGIVQVPRRQW